MSFFKNIGIISNYNINSDTIDLFIPVNEVFTINNNTDHLYMGIINDADFCTMCGQDDDSHACIFRRHADCRCLCLTCRYYERKDNLNVRFIEITK